MKAVMIELGDPSAFLADITITPADGSITLSCSSVKGTSTVKVGLLFVAGASSITSNEFDVLAGRIGTLGDLDTTAKTSLVAAINENTQDIADIGNDLDTINSNVANDWTACSDYKASSESGANTILYSFGKQRTLSFQGVQRVHEEDEVLMTLPPMHRPIEGNPFGIGMIGTTPVVVRLNRSNGQLSLYLINGATSSARLYFAMSWVVA